MSRSAPVVRHRVNSRFRGRRFEFRQVFKFNHFFSGSILKIIEKKMQFSFTQIKTRIMLIRRDCIQYLNSEPQATKTG